MPRLRPWSKRSKRVTERFGIVVAEHGAPDDEAVEEPDEEPRDVICRYVAADLATLLVCLDEVGERAREVGSPLLDARGEGRRAECLAPCLERDLGVV